MGRILIIAGMVLIVLGLLSYVVPLFRLPGDIKYEGANVKIYFPIVTCIVLSILLTIIINLLRK